MSKQLALSATFSVLTMAIYVLFGAQSAREPLALGTMPAATTIEIAAPALPETALRATAELLPAVR